MARDTNKFLELLKPNYNDALKYARALCAKLSPSEADDVLQDAIIKALENAESLKDESKFRSWFFKIITREFYSAVRKHFWKRFLPLEDYMQIPEMPEVYSKIEQSERSILLNKALSKLSAKERAAILLFEIGEFSIEEIKEIQNEKSLSTIKSRLSRTREKLRNIINELENPKTNFFVLRDSPEGDLTNETIGLISEAEQKLW